MAKFKSFLELRLIEILPSGTAEKKKGDPQVVKDPGLRIKSIRKRRKARRRNEGGIPHLLQMKVLVSYA